MPDTQISEEMCLAAAKSDYVFDGRGDWDKASRIDRERYCERSKKALEAALSGHVVVPRTISDAQLNKALGREGDARITPMFSMFRDFYNNIVAAPPVQEIEG